MTIVCNGAQLQCSMGTTPGTFTVLPENLVNAVNNPAATIMDNIPMKNVLPFGMCTTLSNPQVAAATSAAQGVLTPQPCIPVIAAPWTPGAATVMVSNKPALNSSSTCMCNWGGAITVTNPGQQTVKIP